VNAVRGLVSARGFGRDATTAAIFAGAAAVLGAVTALDPMVGVGLLAVVVIGVLVIADITAVPALLVLAMFGEGLALGPELRVGRLAGVFALAVVAYYVTIYGTANLRPNALLLVSAGYGIWTFASVYWSEFPGLAYETTFRYLLAFAYMIVFALLVRTPRQVAAVFATFAAGALVFGVAAFAGYATAPDSYSVEESARGLTGDHNYFAAYQVLALPAVLAVAAFDRRPIRTVVYYAAACAIVLSVVASLSRSGLLALTAVVLVTLALPWRFFFRHATQKLTYVATLVAAAAVVALAGAAAFLDRALTIFEEQGPSGARGSMRVDIWRAAWTGYREDPVLGLGAGNFRGRSFDLLQATPGANSAEGYQSVKGKYVHNMFLGNLVELGVIGFALFIAIVALTAWYLARSYMRSRTKGDAASARFSVALLVSLLSFGIAGMFLSVELSKALWIVVGLALALDVMTRSSPAGGAPPARARAGPRDTRRLPHSTE
jgi:putative inorganic carbon (HCO3(-)) transporter